MQRHPVAAARRHDQTSSLSTAALMAVDLRWLFPIRRPAWPGARLLIGLAILGALLAAFAACGSFRADAVSNSYGPALFFSVNIAYIVPVFGFICGRTYVALAALDPILDTDADTVAHWRERIYRKPLRWLVTVLLLGISAGVLHNLVLAQDTGGLTAQFSEPSAIALTAGTMAIWIVFTFVIGALIDNALVLRRAAGCARVGPFGTAALRPFATVAVISTLALIGAQAAFPIMSIDGDFNPLAYVPGLLATGGSMLLLAALPVWPVHRRLVAMKRGILAELDQRISAMPLPDPAQSGSLGQLTALLTYRREVAASSEWPFDLGVLARLGLYLIIPPLTWVGAALIENVVEAFL